MKMGLVSLIIVLIGVTILFGVPTRNSVDLSSTRSVIICILHKMVASPQRVITNDTQLTFIVEHFSRAYCRLDFPTLGGLMGPIIFFDANNRPIAAFMYHYDLKGFVEHPVSFKMEKSDFTMKKLWHGASLRRFTSSIFLS
ncbi:MAG: hypothetical protein JWM04_512 [Verrucomicrobiales bacterium]|nr:hypothetical protein [Verrucomicrobiales bacterium]